jgi:hypothetical protein
MKYWIIFIACVLLCGNGMCFHILGRFEIVNILVNKENNAILPENIFDLRLEKGSAYSVAYNVKKVIDDAEKAVIAEKMGTVPVPEFRYVSNGERMLGVMPPNIRLMFDNLDALCATNGMDGLAVSIDSKLLNNGELARGIYFVITNTPPTPEVVSKMHPVFGKLLSPEFEMKGTSATKGIPIGANPIQWLRAADNDASSIR